MRMNFSKAFIGSEQINFRQSRVCKGNEKRWTMQFSPKNRLSDFFSIPAFPLSARRIFPFFFFSGLKFLMGMITFAQASAPMESPNRVVHAPALNATLIARLTTGAISYFLIPHKSTLHFSRGFYKMDDKRSRPGLLWNEKHFSEYLRPPLAPSRKNCIAIALSARHLLSCYKSFDGCLCIGCGQRGCGFTPLAGSTWKVGRAYIGGHPPTKNIKTTRK